MNNVGVKRLQRDAQWWDQDILSRGTDAKDSALRLTISGLDSTPSFNLECYPLTRIRISIDTPHSRTSTQSLPCRGCGTMSCYVEEAPLLPMIRGVTGWLPLLPNAKQSQPPRITTICSLQGHQLHSLRSLVINSGRIELRVEIQGRTVRLPITPPTITFARLEEESRRTRHGRKHPVCSQQDSSPGSI